METSTDTYSASFHRILHCYLEHHVHHHAEARLPWILSRGVHGGKIEQRGARLLADGVHQHLLPYTWRPCQQDGFYQRAVLVEHLRTCRQRASDLYPINDTHFLQVTVWAAWLPYPVARLRTAIRSAARPSVTALARYHFASAWSRGSCSHLTQEGPSLTFSWTRGGKEKLLLPKPGEGSKSHLNILSTEEVFFLIHIHWWQFSSYFIISNKTSVKGSVCKNLQASIDIKWVESIKGMFSVWQTTPLYLHIEPVHW